MRYAILIENAAPTVRPPGIAEFAGAQGDPARFDRSRKI
jgi:hypothetical protein